MNPESAHAVAARLSGGGGERIPQTDVFFRAPGGRLKLRMLEDRAELISYHRADEAAARRSEYHVAPVTHPGELRQALAHALGEAGVVRKERRLYLVGQTRIHIDRVEDLGDFLEIEVVLRPDQPEAEGRAIAEDMLRELGVEINDLIGCAYVDLLQEKGKAHGT